MHEHMVKYWSAYFPLLPTYAAFNHRLGVLALALLEDMPRTFAMVKYWSAYFPLLPTYAAFNHRLGVLALALLEDMPRTFAVAGHHAKRLSDGLHAYYPCSRRTCRRQRLLVVLPTKAPVPAKNSGIIG